jgi:hypothetical protein
MVGHRVDKMPAKKEIRRRAGNPPPTFTDNLLFFQEGVWGNLAFEKKQGSPKFFHPSL